MDEVAHKAAYRTEAIEEIDNQARLALRHVEEALVFSAEHKLWTLMRYLAETRESLERCVRPDPTPLPGGDGEVGPVPSFDTSCRRCKGKGFIQEGGLSCGRCRGTGLESQAGSGG